MKERIIISVIESLLTISGLLIFLAIILAIGFAVCGCEEKSVEWGEASLWCQPCDKPLIGTYVINDGYCFQCSTCSAIYSNAQWELVGKKKLELLTAPIRPKEPNEAPYKAWFGWE